MHKKLWGFGRNALTLAAGTLVAQVLTVGFAPVLTRLYSPADMGIVAICLAIVAILGCFSTGGYTMVVLNSSSPLQAWTAVRLVVVISFTCAFFILIIGIMTRLGLERWTDITVPWGLPILISALLGVSGAYQGLYHWANRRCQYARLAKNRSLNAIVVGCVSTALGFAQFGAYGLLLGSVLGQFVSTSVLAFQIMVVDKETSTENPGSMVELGRLFADYPRYFIPAQLLGVSASQAQPLLFSCFFGESIVGFLNLYQRAVALPIELLGNSISDVFARQAGSKIADNRDCRKLILTTASVLLCVGMVPFLALLFAGPWLFSSVFGSQWVVAGEFARTMSWAFLLGFVVSPLSRIFYLARRQRLDFALQIFVLPAVALSVVGGYYIWGDAHSAVLLWTVAYCAKYVIQFYLSYRIGSCVPQQGVLCNGMG